ncbi:MAG: hypothetical protein FWG10_04270 [Eubacteriaceae bacterium]|nr:hypothetical protein [Eubacteriaceae bacterium]
MDASIYFAIEMIFCAEPMSVFAYMPSSMPDVLPIWSKISIMSTCFREVVYKNAADPFVLEA